MSDESGLCPKCGTALAADAPAGLCPRCLVLAGFDSDVVAAGSDPGMRSQSGSGPAFQPPAAEEIAPWFPQLEILELIGHGGMGAVYKARQPKLDRIVALKIIRPESAQAPTFAERFTREARTLARLSHPHVVALHDFGEVSEADSPDAEPLYYFIMEYVDGASLRELLEAGPIDAEQALRIVSQICDALQFAHDEGVVHRDIKPENILIDQRGRVRIADFGLARLLVSTADDFTLTATHQVMGTPLYMAPEQMTGSHAVDHRADLYSLGVVLYEMLTGELPMGQFDPPSLRAGVDVRLDDIVRKSLAREPERRFQRASEVRMCVDEVTGHGARQMAPTAQRPQAFSSMANREVMNVFRFMASDAEQSTHHRPEMPAMLMIVMCAVGCLTVLMPWFQIEIPQETEILGWNVRLENSMSRTVYGSDEEWGGVASILFGVCGLLIIMVPADKRTAIGLPLVLIGLSGSALTMAIIFQAMPDNYSIPQVTEVTDFGAQTSEDKSRVLQAVRFTRLRDVKNPLEYREGFYAALGLSISILLLSAIGVRNALAHRQPKSVTPAPIPASRPGPVTGGSDLDLVALRSELDAPSLSVMIAGVLMFLIHGAATIHFLAGGSNDELAGLMTMPGVLIGVLMLSGGIQLRKMNSRGWAMIGCIAGLIPISPGWILTAAACTWALVVMDRPNIKQAFVDYARQRHAENQS